MRYIVRATTESGVIRDEIIDTESNVLFNKCADFRDVAYAYTAYWNINKSRPVLTVLGVYPLDLTITGFPGDAVVKVTQRADNIASIKRPLGWRSAKRSEQNYWSSCMSEGQKGPKVVRAFLWGNHKTGTFIGVLVGSWDVHGGGNDLQISKKQSDKGFTVYYITNGGFGVFKSRRVKTDREAILAVEGFFELPKDQSRLY